MFLCLRGDWGLIRSLKGGRCTAGPGVRLCRKRLNCVIRIRCPHLLRPLPGPESKLRAEIQDGADETDWNRRRQDDRLAQTGLPEIPRGYSVCFCDSPRVNIQL